MGRYYFTFVWQLLCFSLILGSSSGIFGIQLSFAAPLICTLIAGYLVGRRFKYDHNRLPDKDEYWKLVGGAYVLSLLAPFVVIIVQQVANSLLFGFDSSALGVSWWLTGKVFEVLPLVMYGFLFIFLVVQFVLISFTFGPFLRWTIGDGDNSSNANRPEIANGRHTG